MNIYNDSLIYIFLNINEIIICFGQLVITTDPTCWKNKLITFFPLTE